MGSTFQIGLCLWGLWTLIQGVLVVRAGRSAGFPALNFYFRATLAAHLIMVPLFLKFNTYYGPYWYARNAYSCVELFLLTVVLAELFQEARRGIVVGVVLATFSFFPMWGMEFVSQAVLAVVAGLLSFIEDERGHIAQGVFALLVFPLIAGYSTELWAAFIPTASAVLAQVVWLYAVSQMGQRPQCR